MRKKRHSAEQIVKRLRTAEIELARGLTVKQACKKIEVDPAPNPGPASCWEISIVELSCRA